MDRNSKRALKIFEKAKRDKAKHSAFGIDAKPMRVRLAKHVDTSKADPNCKRCHGTGTKGTQVAGDQRIPIICRCVGVGGGVQTDKLDELLKEGQVSEH